MMLLLAYWLLIMIDNMELVVQILEEVVGEDQLWPLYSCGLPPDGHRLIGGPGQRPFSKAYSQKITWWCKPKKKGGGLQRRDVSPQRMSLWKVLLLTAGVTQQVL